LRKPEQIQWRRFRRVLDQIPGMIHDRIETKGTSIGVPDVAYSFSDHHGWIELKVMGRGGSLSHWTSIQRNWLVRRNGVGGYCWLLVEADGRDYLLNASAAQHLGQRSYTGELRGLATTVIDRSFDPIWLTSVL